MKVIVVLVALAVAALDIDTVVPDTPETIVASGMPGPLMMSPIATILFALVMLVRSVPPWVVFAGSL